MSSFVGLFRNQISKSQNSNFESTPVNTICIPSPPTPESNQPIENNQNHSSSPKTYVKNSHPKQKSASSTFNVTPNQLETRAKPASSCSKLRKAKPSLVIDKKWKEIFSSLKRKRSSKKFKTKSKKKATIYDEQDDSGWRCVG